MSDPREPMTVDAPAPPSLPQWIVVPILAGLAVVSAVIVLIGWIVMMPDSAATAHAAKVHRLAQASTPTLAEADPGSGGDWTSRPTEIAEEPSDLSNREWGARPSPSLSLLQRIPRVLPDAPPMDLASNSPQPLRAPIRWTPDAAPAVPGAMGLLMPIEIARFEDEVVPYLLRRLQVDDAPRPLRLAVTPAVHDDLGQILAKMGDGYRFANLRRHDLLSLETLRKCDVVFLTCADLYLQDFQAVASLRRFVEQGGTLYASDLCGDLILQAFPEYRGRVPLAPGIPQDVEARVVDKGLASHLGRAVIPLTFEAPGWRPAAFDPAKVTICLRGMYRNNFGHPVSAPLLVKFRCKRGAVIFTSFHHTKNDSQIVTKLLDYLVFASVSARSENRVKDLMQRSRFAPEDIRSIALTMGDPVESRHEHAGGGLQIALGFEHAGARLKLRLQSPSGNVIEHEDIGDYLIEIPSADAGVWRYAITPTALPHPHFPIVVAIGTPKS